MDREQFLEVYRHSLAHILAKAVMEIFGRENVQIAIGPQIADGMYYDFLLPRGISTEDFPAIEQKMKEIMKRKEAWTRKVVDKAEALQIFKGQKYKEELINDLPGDETITVYYTGDDFVDLCRGPHVENSAELLSVAYMQSLSQNTSLEYDENFNETLLAKTHGIIFETQAKISPADDIFYIGNTKEIII